MKPNETRLTMIRLLVKKGIEDIKDCPERGIRNLLEMVELFAQDSAQKGFLQTVLEQLRNIDSAYYPLVEQLVKVTDTDTLVTVGMNLGYKSLTYGADVIRGIKKTEGVHVPWCIMIEAGDGETLTPDAIEDIIKQGMPLGIYCYLIGVDGTYPEPNELIRMLARQKECTFVLLLDPATVSVAVCEDILAAKNAAAMIDLERGKSEQHSTAAKTLMESGCLCGGYMSLNNDAIASITPEMLEKTRALGLTIFINAPEKIHPPRLADDVDVISDFAMLRRNLNIPVFPIDLYADIVRLDRYIYGEGRLACVKSDGQFAFMSDDGGEVRSVCNIQNHSLAQALRDRA